MPLGLLLILIVVLVTVLIEGCSTKLPNDSANRSLFEVYQDFASRKSLQRRALRHSPVDLTAYTRTVHNELDVQFPLLPNPSIVLFVFPHIVGEAPIPGYATTFHLYQKHHYALPGEVLK